MKFTICILLFIISKAASASVSKEFCSQYFYEKDSHASEMTSEESITALSFFWKLLVRPSSMVTINKISDSVRWGQEQGGKRLAFLNLPSMTITKVEKNGLRQLQKTRDGLLKDLEKTGIFADLNQLKDQDECPRIIESHPKLLERLEQIKNESLRYYELVRKKKEVEAYLLLENKKRFLKKNGWVIVSNKNFNQIHNSIMQEKPESLLFIGHSTSEGKLIDFDGNIIPKNFFLNFSQLVSNLIVFNCYSNKVNEYYSLDGSGMQVFYAEPVASLRSILGESTPMNSLKIIKDLKFLKKELVESNCTFETVEKVSDDNLGVYLNNFYIGALVPHVSFPCNYLKDENIIEIYSNVKKTHMGTLGLYSGSLKVKNNSFPFTIEEYISSFSYRHIVSKTKLFIKGEKQ